MIWLTDILKNKHLRELAAASRNDLDDGVMPLLFKINALDGMVTTGCCAGHVRSMRGAHTHPFDKLGYVSIRTDAERNTQFECVVIPVLLKQPFMDHVAKMYERDEQGRLWCRFVFAFHTGCMEKFVYQFVFATYTENYSVDDNYVGGSRAKLDAEAAERMEDACEAIRESEGITYDDYEY